MTEPDEPDTMEQKLREADARMDLREAADLLERSAEE